MLFRCKIDLPIKRTSFFRRKLRLKYFAIFSDRSMISSFYYFPYFSCSAFPPLLRYVYSLLFWCILGRAGCLTGGGNSSHNVVSSYLFLLLLLFLVFLFSRIVKEERVVCVFSPPSSFLCCCVSSGCSHSIDVQLQLTAIVLLFHQQTPRAHKHTHTPPLDRRSKGLISSGPVMCVRLVPTKRNNQ